MVQAAAILALYGIDGKGYGGAMNPAVRDIYFICLSTQPERISVWMACTFNTGGVIDFIKRWE